jgi:hypothetical protein
MFKLGYGRLAVLVLAAVVAGAGCILVPEIKDKVVELALSGSTTVEFASVGEKNTHDETGTVDIRDDLDLQGLLQDAGVDVSDVKDVKFAGVAYRVIQPDPDPDREIQDGTVTIRRGGGAETPLVTNLNVKVNGATSWQTATLDPAGVAIVNDLLADVLAEAKGGMPAADTQITYHVTGDSAPADVETNFKWELRLSVSIVGKVKVSVPD